MKTRITLLFVTFAIILFFLSSLTIQSSEKSDPTQMSPHPWQGALSQLSDEEKSSLIAYLKIMLAQSEAGYVLFGVKPVCLEAIEMPTRPVRNWCFGSQCRLTQNEFGAGLDAWNRLQALVQENPVTIVRYDHPDPPYHAPHSVWIHRTAFFNAVNQNLSLFQSILGPEVNADLLYNTLCDPKKAFSPTLAHNKILIGIVLGFGTQNALLGSRFEIIDTTLGKRERPPYSTRFLRAGISTAETINENRPLGSGIPLGMGIPLDAEIKPSIGYRDLNAEQMALRSQLEPSIMFVDRSSPSIPYFLCLKNSSETAALLKRYAEVQPKIQAILQADADTFLEIVATHLLGDTPKSLHIKRPLSPIATSPYEEESILKNEYIPQQLADHAGQIIWDNLLDHDPDYVAAFISGMQEADKNPPGSSIGDRAAGLACIKPIQHSIAATRINDARRNIMDGDDFFKSLTYMADIHEIVPMKLYYRTIESGHGSKLAVNHDRVSIEYMLNPLTGKNTRFPVASNFLIQLNMEELIPGMAHGMLGMQLGELREIYIHSDYAYGCHSNFEPGLALIATVKLFQAASETSCCFPQLAPVDRGLDGVGPAIEGDALKQLYQKGGYAEGFSAWLFYKLGNDLYSLQDVVDSLQRRSEAGAVTETQNDADPILESLIPLLYQRLSQSSV